MVRTYALFCLGLLAILCTTRLTLAQPATTGPARAPAATNPADPTATPQANGFYDHLSKSDTLLDDVGGFRSALAKYGLTFALTESSEVLGNVSGGIRQGVEYDGFTEALLQLDTQKAFDWRGGLFNVSGINVHGRNLSADNLGVLQTASGVEADDSTRLWELWYQQAFDSADRYDLRIGQQSLDQEFMTSPNGVLFVNGVLGWAAVASADLPAGGQDYPLSVLGLRLRARPTDSFTVLAGVYSGSPVNSGVGDPQKSNPSGTTFALPGGTMAIAELRYAPPAPGAAEHPDHPPLPPRILALGVWFDSDRTGPVTTTNRSTLGSNNSGEVATGRSGDYAFYGGIDQIVWHSAAEEDRLLSVFARAMGTPPANRNLVDASCNTGLTLRDPLPHRNSDVFGLAMGYAHVSPESARLDRLADGGPTGSGETFVETFYQYQVTKWFQIQPDFQYFWDPGGEVDNPRFPGHRIRNEAVIGVRINLAM